MRNKELMERFIHPLWTLTKKYTYSLQTFVGRFLFIFKKNIFHFCLVLNKNILAMLYRSLYATYENKDVVTEGITGKRFTVPEIVFDTFHPENVCFCREYNINPDLCFRKGILDMRSCLLGRLVYSH